jgi:hypothetical protein
LTITARAALRSVVRPLAAVKTEAAPTFENSLDGTRLIPADMRCPSRAQPCIRNEPGCRSTSRSAVRTPKPATNGASASRQADGTSANRCAWCKRATRVALLP